THCSRGACTAIEPRATRTKRVTPPASKERWVHRRGDPTVIPRAVTTDMPSSRTSSTQPQPRPQSRPTAATRPTHGKTTTRSVKRRATCDAGSGGPGFPGVVARGSTIVKSRTDQVLLFYLSGARVVTIHALTTPRTPARYFGRGTACLEEKASIP